MTQWGLLGQVAMNAVTGLVKAGTDKERDAEIYNLKMTVKRLRRECDEARFELEVCRVDVKYLTAEASAWQTKWREMFDLLIITQNKLTRREIEEMRVPIDANPYATSTDPYVDHAEELSPSPPDTTE